MNIREGGVKHCNATRAKSIIYMFKYCEDSIFFPNIRLKKEEMVKKRLYTAQKKEKNQDLACNPCINNRRTSRKSA